MQLLAKKNHNSNHMIVFSCRRFFNLVILIQHMKASLWVFLGVWLTCLTSVQAQSYSIDWYTIDGGGGTSQGGPYTLVGTVGQPDAHTSTGGAFTLHGGFWAGIIVPGQGELPTLYIDRSGQIVVISWNPDATGFVLEATPDLSQPLWTPIFPDSPGSVSIPAIDDSQFFRLRK
jgi:hypothetical protein